MLIIFGTRIGYILALSGTLTGTVRAANTLEFIPYAAVTIVETGNSVLTDADGRYRIGNIRAGTYTVRAEALGYASITKRVEISGPTTRLNILLPVEPLALAPLLVSTSRYNYEHYAGPAPWRITKENIHELPGIGQTDVLRALQDLPSVAAASDFSSALYIRGGVPAQTSILLDGAPLINPYHLGGVFSAIDPAAISVVDLYVGGMPASVGDRISGVLKIRTRDGARDRLRGSGALGLASARASLNGPLPGPGSFFIGFRRTYLDLLSGLAYDIGLANSRYPYAFADVHMKATYGIAQPGRISVAAYVNQERINRAPGSVFGSADADWGTIAGSATYEHAFAGGVSGRIQLAGTRFGGEIQYGAAKPGPTARDAVQGNASTAVGTIRADVSLDGEAHRVRLGIKVARWAAKYQFVSTGPTISKILPSLDKSRTTTSFAAYVEDRAELGPVNLRIGARVFGISEGDPLLLPRVGITVPIMDRLQLVFASGRYAQAVRTLRNEESTWARFFAYDFVIPVALNSNIPKSVDVTLGVRADFPATRVSVDAYARWFHDLRLAPVPINPDEAAVLSVENRRPGSGFSRGIELFFQHSRGNTQLSLGYTLADYQRISRGFEYTPSFERTHRIVASAVHNFDFLGVISARFVWGSGLPYTPAVGFLGSKRYNPIRPGYVPGKNVVVLGRYNSERLPGYSRLDVKISRQFRLDMFQRTISISPYVQVFNLFNSRNVIRATPNERGSPGLVYAPQLPILPTFGVEWKF